MRLVLFLTVGLSLIAATVTGAHGGPQPWTESKAERVVRRDASVTLPAEQRVALREELRQLIPRLRMLEQTALDANEQQAASRFHNLRYRYSTLLRQVEGGVGVAAAGCNGAGGMVAEPWFRHFLCDVSSSTLQVPSIELVYDDPDELPRIVTGATRAFGPYGAKLLVHVTGPSSIAYRRAE
jgi:hypothetical protein